MNAFTAFLIILLLFGLRFGLPLVVTMVICRLTNRFCDSEEVKPAIG